MAGPVPFASDIGDPKSDAAFLEVLKKCSGKKSGGKKGEGLSHVQLKKLRLKESDVAKVTREGISHLAFHPQASQLIVATGDKQGHVALWDVDKKTAPEVCTATAIINYCLLRTAISRAGFRWTRRPVVGGCRTNPKFGETDQCRLPAWNNWNVCSQRGYVSVDHSIPKMTAVLTS